MRSFLVEADGGSRGNPGPAAYGAVVKDADTGEVLVELAEPIGTATNNVAEYRGLLAGLRAAYDLDPQARVEARLDSRLVVEQMSGRWAIRHPDLRPLALAARGVFPAGRVRYTWVPRAANAHADRLLNAALDAAARRTGTLGAAAPGAGTAGGAGARPRGDEVGARPRVDEAEVEPAPAPRLVGWGPDLGPPTSLLLLRHGETADTVAKRFSGCTGSDPPLTERGRWQAERAAAMLAARGGADDLVCSPLRRAQETAAVVGARLGLTPRVDPAWTECDFGQWDGSTFAEVQRRWPAELAGWLASTTMAPPGGESFDAMAARVRRARDALLHRHPGRTVLVVTHVTPVKMLVRFALGAPPDALYRMELDPASLTRVDWWSDGMASLRGFNDTGHLHAS